MINCEMNIESIRSMLKDGSIGKWSKSYTYDVVKFLLECNDNRAIAAEFQFKEVRRLNGIIESIAKNNL